MSIRCRGGPSPGFSGRRIEGAPPEGRVELLAVDRDADGRETMLGFGAAGLLIDFEREAALDRALDLELADDFDEELLDRALLDREPLDREPLDRLLAPLDRLPPLLDFAELPPEDPEDFAVVFSFWARTS